MKLDAPLSFDSLPGITEPTVILPTNPPVSPANSPPSDVTNVPPGSILIVTVTKVEAQVVLDVFSPKNKWARQRIGNKTYYSLGIHGGVPTFMVQSEMGTATPGGSLLTVHQAIQDLHPQAVIMCGIAFGLRQDKQKLGDVLVARQLQYYEPQKLNIQQSQIPRGDRAMASERLLDHFRSGDMDWQGPQRHFGLVLSGEKLVNDPKFRKWLLRKEPEAIGGEMEGAGLYTAARDAKVDWILVKAICDWADGSKNDNAQSLAANNAAQFVQYVLQLGGWEVPAQSQPAVAITDEVDQYESPRKPSSSPEKLPSSDIFYSYGLENMAKEMIRDGPDYRDALRRLDKMEPEADGRFHRELREEFQRVMRDQALPVRERAGAGDALAQLGDPRFRSDAWFLPNEDLLGFVEIPAGSFLMGTYDARTGRIASRENPQHMIDLPTYYIGRFPVTVGQYRAFLKETHYRQDIDTRLAHLENHPVVSVTWHDVLQYCHWLTDRLRAWPGTPQPIANLLITTGDSSSWTVTLPSEAEWEKAARGTRDGRVYPWGSKFDFGLANYRDSGLGTTSAVGCFEGGRSPYGIHDLCGNTWEWTRSNWGFNLERPQFKYPYVAQDGREDMQRPNNVLRVLRGGSFDNSPEEIRCSFRRADLPNASYDHVGFRLVITSLPQRGVHGN